MTSKGIPTFYNSIRRISNRVVPKEYTKNPQILKEIYKWLIIGVLIRIVLMPFSCSGDLLSTYHRSYLLAFKGSVQFLDPHQFFQAIFLYIFQYMIPLDQLLMWSNGNSVELSFWLNVIDNPWIYKSLFLLKILYLIFDIMTAVVILNIFDMNAEKGKSALILWITNPVMIFAVYIFGRYEVIPIFFIALCIYLLKYQKIQWASLFLGLSILDRYYALMFLPILVILVKGGLLKRAKIVLISLMPIALFNVINKIYLDKSPAIAFANSSFLDILLSMEIQIKSSYPLYTQSIYIFIFLYILVLLSIFDMKEINEKEIYIKFVMYSSIVLLGLYSTTIFSPHYFAWIIPFFVIYYGYTQSRRLIYLHGLQIILLTVYTFNFLRLDSTWLFLPVNYNIIYYLLSPLEIITSYFDGLKLISLSRTVLDAACLYMAYMIISSKDCRGD